MIHKTRLLTATILSILILTGITIKAGLSEESTYTPYGYIKNEYKEDKLSKYRSNLPFMLYNRIQKNNNIDRHYAIIALAEKEEKDDKIIPLLGLSLLDNDIRVRSAAFDGFVIRGKKELAEAVCKSLFSDDETRYDKAFALADKHIIDIYMDIFLKNHDNAYALKGLDTILSSDNLKNKFKLNNKTELSLIDKIIKYCAHKYSSGSEQKRSVILDVVFKREKQSLRKIISEYVSYTSTTENFLTVCSKYNRVLTENAIFENLNLFKLQNSMRHNLFPVKFLKGIASADLANRIIDSIISGRNKQSVEFKTKCLAAWPVEKSKDQLIKYIKRGKREAPYAVEAASRTGDKSFTPLILKYMKRTSVNNRVICSKALGYLKDEKAVQPLCRLLEKEKNYQAGNSAMFALACIGDEKAIPSILKYVGRKKSAARYAVEALVMMPSDKAVPFLYNELIKHKSGSWGYKRSFITDALILSGNETAEYMRNILKDKKSSDKLISSALQLLTYTGNKQDVRLIIPFLKSKKYSVKNQAEFALGNLGTASDIPAIIKSASSPYSVRNTLVMIGKPGIPVLKKYAENKKHKSREVAVVAMNYIYNAYAEYRKGNINLTLGKYDEAEKNFSNAFSKKRNLFKARLNQGVSRYYQKKYKKAIEVFHEVRIKSPELRAEALTNMAAAYRQGWGTSHYTQEYPMLAKIYTKMALNLKNNLTPANYNMAWLYEENLILNDALIKLDKTIENDTSHIKAVILKASVLAQNGMKEEALIILQNLSSRTDLPDNLKDTVEENLKILNGESI